MKAILTKIEDQFAPSILKLSAYLIQITSKCFQYFECKKSNTIGSFVIKFIGSYFFFYMFYFFGQISIFLKRRWINRLKASQIKEERELEAMEVKLYKK